MSSHRVIVVGGGLAGLAASVRIAESGVPVDLFSVVPVKRSHSVCAQGGINACNEVARQQGYSEYEHFDETIYGGDFLADQHPALEMANWAPKIIDLLDRMGVPFNRTAEGFRDLRLFGGSLFKRTHFSGATTGQQLLYALDEQTRRYESEGKVTKYEFWEFLWPVIEDGRCVGIVAQDMRTMQIRAYRADAVVMATGGCGLVFGRSTNSTICTGAAAARCYQAGVWYGNPEMIQVHPTAIPGADKTRLMSESARGEGGRVWVPRKKGDTRKPREIPEAERYYFLEERYPAYGNIVPRDIATREIFSVCVNDGLGVYGENQVYLDLTHLPATTHHKLEGILEIYKKFAGEDPQHEPMRIFPSVHYSMGGLWTTFAKGSYNPPEPREKHKSGAAPPIDSRIGQGMQPGAIENARTNIEGLYAFGEVNFAYHGANRLGANALLSCIFDGLFCGVGVVNYLKSGTPSKSPHGTVSQSAYDRVVQQEERKARSIIDTVGKGGDDEAGNPYLIHRDLGNELTAACTVVKNGPRLEQCLARVGELKERYSRMKLADGATWTNQSFGFARAVGDMLVLADAIALASIQRRESRGAHYRTDYPNRDDANFMKSSVAKFDAAKRTTTVELVDLDASLIKPTARTYGKKDSATEQEKKSTPTAAMARASA
ncbi:MAG: succinate dehydrogenase flavoprotein subunit [Phycisphaerales bacterium]|nr:succinate dehydrogenase flavoprotein subunit [Phycisphaerales bacterium]